MMNMHNDDEIFESHDKCSKRRETFKHAIHKRATPALHAIWIFLGACSGDVFGKVMVKIPFSIVALMVEGSIAISQLPKL